jgi:hypothetical protein
MSDESSERAKPNKRARGLTALIRWLHIYVSVLGFLALLFFSVTGFTLNHAEWLLGGQQEWVRQIQGNIEVGLLGGETTGASPAEAAFPAPAVVIEEAASPVEEMGAPFEETAAPPPGAGAPLEETGGPVGDAGGVDKLAVVETLRSRHRLKGAADIAVDKFQCFVTFQRPGYSADVFIDRATGDYELIEVRPGLVGLLNDLHTGRAAGPVWPWVIDVSALIMAVASITGLALVLLIKRRRRSGIVAAVLGSVAVVVVYLLCVP